MDDQGPFSHPLPANDTPRPEVGPPGNPPEALGPDPAADERALDAVVDQLRERSSVVAAADLVVKARAIYVRWRGEIAVGRPRSGNSARGAEFLEYMGERLGRERRHVERLWRIGGLDPQVKAAVRGTTLDASAQALEPLTKLPVENQVELVERHAKDLPAFKEAVAKELVRVGAAKARKPSTKEQVAISLVVPATGASIKIPTGTYEVRVTPVGEGEYRLDLAKTAAKGVPEGAPPDAVAPSMKETAIESVATVAEQVSVRGPDWERVLAVEPGAISDGAKAVSPTDEPDKCEEIDLGEDAEAAIHGSLARLLAVIQGKKKRERIIEVAQPFGLSPAEKNEFPRNKTIVYALGDRNNGVLCVGYGRTGPAGEAPTKAYTTWKSLDGGAIAIVVPLEPEVDDLRPPVALVSAESAGRWGGRWAGRLSRA